MLEANNMSNALAVLTGPTIAPEAADGVMTTALVASSDLSIATRLANTLTTPTFVLHPASDPVGAELGRVQERRRPCLRACGRAQAGRNHRW